MIPRGRPALPRPANGTRERVPPGRLRRARALRSRTDRGPHGNATRRRAHTLTTGAALETARGGVGEKDDGGEGRRRGSGEAEEVATWRGGNGRLFVLCCVIVLLARGWDAFPQASAGHRQKRLTDTINAQNKNGVRDN